MESSAVQAVNVKFEPCDDEDVCIFSTEEPTAVYVKAQNAEPLDDVKHEPRCDGVCIKHEPRCDGVCINHEPRCDGVCIKTEPSCSDVCIHELGSAAAELYSDHVVKDELVVGPVVVERHASHAPTDITEAEQSSIVPDILRRDSRVRLRRILVDMLTGTQSTDRDTPTPTHGVDVEHNTSGFRNIKRNNGGEVPQERQSTRSSYKCDNCKYVTGIRSSITRHMKTHSENKRYKCDHCSYASHVKRNLSAHLRKHTADKRYKCDQCSYACYHKNELLKHVTKHTGEKPYKCEQCSYAGNLKRNLSAHLRKHTGDNRYKCDQCSYACYYKYELLKHIRKHTGDKPYKCDQCSYACHYKRELLNHIRKNTVENEKTEKPYKCHHCNYASANKCNLIVHIKSHTHTAELPYKCVQCGYASRREFYLLNHQCGQYSYSSNTSNRESSPPDLAVVRKPEARCYVNKRRELRLTVGESQDRTGEGRIVKH